MNKKRTASDRSNNILVKAQGHVRRDSLPHRAVRALARSFIIAACFMVSLAVPSTASSAEVKKEKGSTHPSRRKQNGVSLETALPFKIHGYIIGNPSERNNYPGVYSGITDPETVVFRNYYSISCSPNDGGDIKVYRKWSKGPSSEDTWTVGAGYSISVINFINSNKKQYIYGMISNTRALTNGVPVIVERLGWNCALYNS